MKSRTTVHLNSDISEKKQPVALRLGMFSLGLSFAIWALIAALYSVNAFRFLFLGSWISEATYFLSLGLTVLGLIAIVSSTQDLLPSDRKKVLASIVLFASINFVGFLFLILSFVGYNNNFGSFQGISWSPWFVAYVEIPMFVSYLVIFASLLVPYLEKTSRWLLLVPSTMAVLWFVLVLLSNLSVYTFPHQSLPGTIFPSLWEQLFNPFFGVPGLLFSDGFTNFQPSYAMLFAVASNLSYALLFFRSGRSLNREVTQRRPVAT